MKNLNLTCLNLLFRSVLLGLLIFGLISCDKKEVNCLPYEGFVVPYKEVGSELYGISCLGGVIVKVTNTSVDSYFDINGKRESNVIGLRIPKESEFWTYFDFPLDKDNELFKQRFYFDFRDLVPDDEGDGRVCTANTGAPSRVVVLTSFSISRCEQPTEI
ncbi:hypothetical protein [Algoriphagus marinus]|uniref:hypothetical protein n=1 Tax=Algoriphagus marinus TaxID=1925762 RepID=UPI00094BC3F5|nr:hypothetical protein [Algoriphagus marinus]